MNHALKSALIVAGLVSALLCCVSLSFSQDSWEEDFQSKPPAGKSTFNSTCAGCHGLDGRGSEKAPGIANSGRVQHLTDAQISNVISNGVPGTGMPGFHALTAAQVRSLVSYLRLLQGRGIARQLPGNAERGKAIFSGKGECSSCHVVSGEGGFLGPDLTAYGSEKSSEEIQKALLNSARMIPVGYKPAAVITRDGTRIEGLIRNEDNFSVQLQSQDGSFHFFQKSDLQKFEYFNQSWMPSDYDKRLTNSELKDLISYLMSAGMTKQSAPNSKPPARTNE
ncbi:MAG TPA: c-type cytochrome [Candidatus Solibacter sp.]|nr:c-type cytochrome [Candidatus Solibacter sp.]